MVSLACRSHGDHRSVAASLQRRASAFEPRLSHAERVCGSTAKRSVPSCNGPGRCGVWAFAPWPVAQPALQGAHTGGKGRRLKLAVVRRIWAGQVRRQLRGGRIGVPCLANPNPNRKHRRIHEEHGGCDSYETDSKPKLPIAEASSRNKCRECQKDKSRHTNESIRATGIYKIRQ